MYPKYAEINGTKYPINYGYKYALKCFELIDNDEIFSIERILAIIYILFGFIPDKDINLFFEKCVKFLQCNNIEKQDNGKKDMDFNQDRALIVASFRSDYQIDLSTENIHWWNFVELIQGLTQDCSLSKVRELRNLDTSEIKSAKEKRRLEEAKKAVKLKATKKISSEKKKKIEKFMSQLGKEVIC